MPAPGEIIRQAQAPAAHPPAAPKDSGALLPMRQLGELPADELQALAEGFGVDSSLYPTPAEMVAAIHERRQLIASMERDAMLDVVKWGRRPVAANAPKEQLAQEIARIRSMRFSGLSHRGLLVLARLRGADVEETDTERMLIKRLKRQEGLFAKLGRKGRAMLGSVVANMMGADAADSDYQFLPPSGGASPNEPADAGARKASLKEEIEEAGLFGGLAGRLKKTADSYLKEKMDEIETRIDKKLDDIDKRLAEWRDKEVANRIRIIKITLWASVIVGFVSLTYSYIVYLVNHVIRK